MAGNDARNHHYIPQCYLRGFATKRKKNWYTTAGRMETFDYFEPNVRNICAKRDFNRIEVEGYAADAIEKAMAELESEFANAIRNVSTSRVFEGADRDWILYLMAFLWIRSPQVRERWRQTSESITKIVMGNVLATKERYEQQIAQAKANGEVITGNVTYEEAKRFFDDEQYKSEVPTERHLVLEMSAVKEVVPYLEERRWTLYYGCNEAAGKFITTDRPVMCSWTDPESVPLMIRKHPAVGMRHTKVYFPLTKDVALIGTVEGEEGIVAARMNDMAEMNTYATAFAIDCFYSVTKAFPYNRYDGAIVQDRFFLTQLKEYRSQIAATNAAGQ